ncbi:MAG TPA: hypothetical protein VJX67_00625, partial [Blastocatellia bacterium]|nr:hypothetical protein [Blastocatellia bacterium]
LKVPIDIVSSAIEITPVEYRYQATANQHSKSVSITSPFSWVLSYSGFAPATLNELSADTPEGSAEIQSFILHHLVMHVVMTRQQGISNIFEALRFPISSKRSPELGGLPLTYISCCISTIRPPDSVIIESTEISGTDAFEEVVNIENVDQIRDPIREEVLELVKASGLEH